MGCKASKEGGKSSGQPKRMKVAVTEASKVPKPKRDPKEFQCESLKGEVVIKPPGSLGEGILFDIYDCEDCDIFLLDWMDSVTIDKCQGCRVFVGPCESSVQVRNSEACTIIVACKQFRLRECKKLDILLFVVGDPAIELSDKLRFGCFQFSYPELEGQFASANLSVYNNQWSRVHDFGAQSGQTSSWTYLEERVNPLTLLKCEHIVSQVPIEHQQAFATTPLVPKTWGRRPPASDENSTLVLFWASDKASLFLTATLKQNLSNAGGKVIRLIETREAKVTNAQAKSLLRASPESTKHVVGASGAIGFQVLISDEADQAVLDQVLTDVNLKVGEDCYVSRASGPRDVKVFFTECDSAVVF